MKNGERSLSALALCSCHLTGENIAADKTDYLIGRVSGYPASYHMQSGCIPMETNIIS